MSVSHVDGVISLCDWISSQEESVCDLVIETIELCVRYGSFD